MADQQQIEQDRTLEERLAHLEDLAFEGRRLRQSVDRLGDGADALGEALLKVDQQQQTLTRLGRQLQSVEETAVSRDELISAHDAEEEDRKEFRKQTMRRSRTTLALILLAGIVSVLLVDFTLEERSASAIRVCEQRNAQTELIVETLRTQGLSADAGKFKELVVDCAEELS